MCYAMLSIGILGFVVWSHHMARVDSVVTNKVCLYGFKDSNHCFRSNRKVAQQGWKGWSSAKVHRLDKLTSTIRLMWSNPSLQVWRVKKMKVRDSGPWGTVWERLFSSIFIMNSNETCASGKQAVIKLSLKEFSNFNECKKVTDPTQAAINCYGVSYVTSNTLIGVGTRRFVMGGNVLNAQRSLKEPVLPTRHFCSVGNNFESSNTVAYELKQLADCSNKNDRKGVDDAVSLKSLFESFKERGVGFKRYKADSLIKKTESLTLQTEEQKKLKK